MTHSNDRLVEELSKNLQKTTELTHTLLEEIRANSTSLAAVEVKLAILTENLNSIHKLIVQGNGQPPILTRIALTEQSVENVEALLDEYREELREVVSELRAKILIEKNARAEKESFERSKTLKILKLSYTIGPGIIALVLILIKLVFGE